MSSVEWEGRREGRREGGGGGGHLIEMSWGPGIEGRSLMLALLLIHVELKI